MMGNLNLPREGGDSRGMYVCLYCDGFNREEQGLVKLMDYIFDHGYKVVEIVSVRFLLNFPPKQLRSESLL